MSNEFQDLNNINYLKDNPNEKLSLWSKLLEYLNEEPAHMITNEDGGEEDSLFDFIQKKVDLSDSTRYEKGFYDQIYNDLVSAINKNPNILLGVSYDELQVSNIEDSYWNSSVAETMLDYGINFDINLRESYYSSFLFENENGIIQEYSRYKGFGSTDAGHSFEKESEIYEGGYNLTFSYFYNEENQKISFEPFTFIISSKDVIEKNHEHYFDLFHFKNGGPRWTKWTKMLNEEIDDKWKWKDIVSAVENTEMYKLGFVGEWASWEEFKGFINSILSSREIPLFGKGIVFKEKYGRVLKPWVSPWSNYYGGTYTYVRDDDKKFSVLDNRKQLDLTRLDENEAKSDSNFQEKVDRAYGILEHYAEEKQKFIDIPSGQKEYLKQLKQPVGSINMDNRQYPIDSPLDVVDMSYFYWPLIEFQPVETPDYYITIACSKIKQTDEQQPERLSEEYCEQYCKDIIQAAIDSLGGDVVPISGQIVAEAILSQSDPDEIITCAHKAWQDIRGYNDKPWILKNYLYLIGDCGALKTLQRQVESLANTCNIFYSDLVIEDTDEKVEIVDKKTFKKFYTNYGHTWARLLMPQNKRRVEIEDLNRNFWVIGQTIALISRDILGEGGAYPNLFGKILNEIMQLWENVIFLWSQVAIQSQKWPAVHSEVVYITFDDLREQLNYDWDFDESSISQLKFYENTVDDRLINRLERSQNLEETVIKFLRQYRLKYADYNVSLYPILRLNNYQKEFYSRCVVLGEYKYCHNYDQLEVDVVDPEDETITNPPQGRTINIDGEKVFFTTFSNYSNDDQSETDLTKLPGQMDYHHCQFKESFFSYSRHNTFEGEEKNYYIIDVDATNFSSWTYGIAEKLDEENYSGCCPVSKSNQMKTENGEMAYNLISFFTDTFATKILNTPKEGLWTTKFSFVCYDIAEMLLYNGKRTQQTQKIYYSQYNTASSDEIADLNDSRKNHHDDIPFQQIEPADNEFGFFKGELLTCAYRTQKADFNFLDLKKIFLRPTSYQYDDYSYYYGADDAPTIIKQDVENDKYALTNYLINVYDNWAQHSDDKTTFWNSRANKIKLPSEIWDEDYNEVIAYSRNNDDVSEIKRKRSEISQAIDNNTIVWSNFDEDWRRDAINKLNINSSEMNPLTILFVSGERYYNFNSKRGEGQTGYNMIATDGLLHHGWPTDSGTKLAGAAIRIPSTTMGPIYSTYPKHSEPTAANNDLWEHYHRCADFYIEREPSRVVYEDNLPKSYQPAELLDKQTDFRKKALRDQNKNWLVHEKRGYGYGWGDIYMVLKKDGERNFTEDNWLVNYVHYKANDNLQYFIPQNAQNFIDMPYNLRTTNNPRVDTRSIAGRISSNLGAERSINSLDDYDYYEQLYQRYIYYNWGINADNKTIDEYLSENNITIKDILYDKNSEYYLNLDKILFGWIRVKDINDVIHTAKFHIDNPIDYSHLESEQIELIEEMRNNSYDGSINKIYNSDGGVQKIKNFIDLINEIYPDGNGCWDVRVLSENIDVNDELACYGNIGRRFGRNISGNDNEEMQWNIWLEDRIMLAQFESQRLLDQELLFNASGNIWPNQILGAAMGIHPEAWYDSDEQIQIQKIEKLIRPLEGQLSSAFVLTLQSDNSITYTITDKFYLNSSNVSYIQNYVFGPDELEHKYARRSIYRYPDYSESNDDWVKDIVSAEGGMSGHWAKRPSTPMRSDEQNKLWYDDIDITGITIDDIRTGYTVCQVIGEDYSWQIEKYKTNRNAEADNLAMSLGLKHASGDDPDFNNIPNGWNYEEEE